jgi:RHS repeat-associated protein
MAPDMMSMTNRIRRWVVAGVLVGLGFVAPLVRAAETVTYYYTNQQGTPLATADASGSILSTADYRPYGSQVLGSPANGPGYTGHVEDQDSGLVYMQARYYDPLVGRFLSSDPKTLDAGSLERFGRFSYASDNPVSNIDPDGKQSWCTPGTCGVQAYESASRQYTYLRDHFDLVAEVKGAYGSGFGAKYNVSSNKGEVDFYPAALGAHISLYFQTKNPIVIPLVKNPTEAKMSIGWGGDLELGVGLSGGLDAEYNPGGAIELTPKVGAGFGEFQQVGPSVTLYHWGDSKSSGDTSEQIPTQSKDWLEHPVNDLPDTPNSKFTL